MAETTTVFRLCGFELPDLLKLRKIRRAWMWAAEICIDELKRLLVCLPTHRFTPAECDLLWANRTHVAGHNRWMVQLLKSVDWKDRCA